MLGIIRFGNQDNPKVLAALGSLLAFYLGESPDEDAKALAARAYLKASYLAKDPAHSAELRKLADRAIQMQTDVKLETVEAELKRELADAEAWYDDLRKKELNWIAAGIDVDAEFAQLYAAEPRTLESRAEYNLDHATIQRRAGFRILATVISIPVMALSVLIAIGYVLIRRIRADRNVVGQHK